MGEQGDIVIGNMAVGNPAAGEQAKKQVKSGRRQTV
jgi:hypothetical protein